MARKPRLYFPGTFYHLLNRGNQRQPIFNDEPDYQTLMAALAAASVRYQSRIHAFCLMPNQFHLLAEVDLFPPVLAVRSLETSVKMRVLGGRAMGQSDGLSPRAELDAISGSPGVSPSRISIGGAEVENVMVHSYARYYNCRYHKAAPTHHQHTL